MAEAAGFSHGAVYSNFDGKTALGIAVVDLLYEREVAALMDAIETEPGGLAAKMSTFATWGQRAIGDPRWARLEMEVAGAAGDDTGVREANTRRYRRLRAAGAQVFEAVVRENEVDLAMTPDELMIGVVALGLGLGLQRAADPDVDGALFGTLLSAWMPPAVSSTPE